MNKPGNDGFVRADVIRAARANQSLRFGGATADLFEGFTT
jgi:hypothetical protein